MYTANTMSSSFEALGMSLLGSSSMANPDPEKADSVAESSRVLVEAIKKDLKPLDIITKSRSRTRWRLIMATAAPPTPCSHYLAITMLPASTGRSTTSSACAKGAGAVRPQALRPVRDDDLHAVGGVPQVLKLLLNKGLLHGDCMTITGRTMAEELAKVPDLPRKDQDVIRQPDNPLYAQGHLAILGATWRRKAAWQKSPASKTGVDRSGPRVQQQRARMHGRHYGEQDQPRRRAGVALRRPERWPWHARDAGADQRHYRQGHGRNGGPDHRRPFLRAAPGVWWLATSRRRRKSVACSRWWRKAIQSPWMLTNC